METANSIKMGTLPDMWKQMKSNTITFCVTEDCNLRCKYCYMTGKNSKNKMSLNTAKDAVDFILSHKENFTENSVIWEFIGGEPFLEIDLIDKVSDYIKLRMYELNHPWFNSYRFSFSTNGILYGTEAVQNYIKKNKKHISIGISLDGDKIKHDLQRIKKDGTGSYDEVIKNVPLWQKQFPGASTKATFSHEDLPYLSDSIISLWDNGIKIVPANVVFEDVWHEGDDIIFENQLKILADYILENKMWKDYSVRFFDKKIGVPLTEKEKNRNYCGSGNKMIAIGTDGRLFPCIRFYDISLNNKKGIVIGDIYNGINEDLLRPFKALSLASQSSDECLNCKVARGCAWCTGCNYDMADTNTIYERSTAICKMHKANVRATEYFWDKFAKVTGILSPREEFKKERIQQENIDSKYLQFILSDSIMPHCNYRNLKHSNNIMSKEVFEKGLDFANKNGYEIVMLGDTENLMGYNMEEYFAIVSNEKNSKYKNFVNIYDNEVKVTKQVSDNTILLVNRENVNKIFVLVNDICKVSRRVNIILEDIDKWDDKLLYLYEEQLDILLPFVVQSYKNNDPIELNVLTDILYTNSMCNCEAGENSFSLAPNGKIYLCPAFYFDNPNEYIGTLEIGINIKNESLLNLTRAPICSNCDCYHCRRCKFLNKKLTREINTPSKIQCVISHIERNKSKKLQEMLEDNNFIDQDNYIRKINYLDPLDNIMKEKWSDYNV